MRPEPLPRPPSTKLPAALAALVLLALAALPHPAAARNDVDRCFEATLADVAACEVDVLDTGGLFCPGDDAIRERVCERLRSKKGETVDVRCEGGRDCSGVQEVSGTVSRTFQLSREEMTCNVTFEMHVEVRLAGTGTIGRCAGGGGS